MSHCGHVMKTIHERSRRRSCPQLQTSMVHLSDRKGNSNATRSTNSMDLIENKLRDDDTRSDNTPLNDITLANSACQHMHQDRSQIETKDIFYEGDCQELHKVDHCRFSTHKQSTLNCNHERYESFRNAKASNEVCYLQGQGDSEIVCDNQQTENDNFYSLAADEAHEYKHLNALSSDDDACVTDNGDCFIKDETNHDDDIVESQLREIYTNELRYKDCDVTFDSISEESDGKRSVFNDVRGETCSSPREETSYCFDIAKTKSCICVSPNANDSNEVAPINLLDTQNTIKRKSKAVHKTGTNDIHQSEVGDNVQHSQLNSKSAFTHCADERRQLRILVKNMFSENMRIHNEQIYDKESGITDSSSTNGVSIECARILSAYTHSHETNKVNDASAVGCDTNADLTSMSAQNSTDPLQFTKGIGLMNADAAHLKTWLLKLLWDSESLLNVNINNNSNNQHYNSNNNQHNNSNNVVTHRQCLEDDNDDYDDDNDDSDVIGPKRTYNKKACVYRAFLISSLSYIISAIDSLLKLVEFQNENQTELSRTVDGAHNLTRFKEIVRVHIGQSINTISDIAAMLQGLVNHSKSAQAESTAMHPRSDDRYAASDIQMWYRSPKEFVQGTGLFESTAEDISDNEQQFTYSQKTPTSRGNVVQTIAGDPVLSPQRGQSMGSRHHRNGERCHDSKAASCCREETSILSKMSPKSKYRTSGCQAERNDRSILHRNVEYTRGGCAEDSFNDSSNCFIVKARNSVKSAESRGLHVYRQTTTASELRSQTVANRNRQIKSARNDTVIGDGFKNITHIVSNRCGSKKPECKDNNPKYLTRSTKQMPTSVDTRTGSGSPLKLLMDKKISSGGDSLTARIAAARERVERKQLNVPRVEMPRKDAHRRSQHSSANTTSNCQVRKSKLAEPKIFSTPPAQMPSSIPRLKTPELHRSTKLTEQKDLNQLVKSRNATCNTTKFVRASASKDESDVTTSEDDAWKLAREDTDGSQPHSDQYFLAQSSQHCDTYTVTQEKPHGDLPQSACAVQSDSDQTELSYQLAPSTRKYEHSVCTENEKSLEALRRQMAAVRSQREIDRKSLSLRSTKLPDKRTAAKRVNSGQDAASKQNRQRQHQLKKVSSSYLSGMENQNGDSGKRVDMCGEGSAQKSAVSDAYWRQKRTGLTRSTRPHRNQYGE